MKNNRGFTVVELAISFCLVSAISLVLIQVVLSLKEVYVSGNIKSILLNKQGIMLNRIYTDLDNKVVKTINSCGISCLEFTFSDTTSSKLSFDPYAKTISYSNYTMKLANGSYFGDVLVNNYNSTSLVGTNNSILDINIPISNPIVNGDYGIHIIYSYNDSQVSVNTNLSTSGLTLSLDNIEMETKVYTINSVNYLFAKVFYHNSNNGVNVFTNKETFLKNTSTDMFSGLFSLELLKGFYSTNLSTTPIDETKQKSLEFILKYPNLSSTSYNNWVQTSNPTSEDISGYQERNITFPGINNSFVGLKYNGENNTNTFIDGSSGTNYYFAIGQIKASDNGIMGPTAVTQTVELWTRIDEYITKYGLSTISY
ncbi:MAG: hypothetical protein ACK5HP_02955 [Bacilli bacterium]